EEQVEYGEQVEHVRPVVRLGQLAADPAGPDHAHRRLRVPLAAGDGGEQLRDLLRDLLQGREGEVDQPAEVPGGVPDRGDRAGPYDRDHRGDPDHAGLLQVARGDVGDPLVRVDVAADPLGREDVYPGRVRLAVPQVRQRGVLAAERPHPGAHLAEGGDLL